jgi:hypothetical protein
MKDIHRKGTTMTIELLDYQVVALILIGVCIGSLVWYIIDLRSEHKDMSRREFAKRVFREFAGLGFEDRVVKSDNHGIDLD